MKVSAAVQALTEAQAKRALQDIIDVLYPYGKNTEWDSDTPMFINQVLINRKVRPNVPDEECEA